MKKFFLNLLSVAIFLFSCHTTNAQTYGWVKLTDSTASGNYMVGVYKDIQCDKNNNLYLTSGSMCFGVSLQKFYGTYWGPMIMGTCDHGDIAKIKTDGVGNAYALLTDQSPFSFPPYISNLKVISDNPATLVDSGTTLFNGVQVPLHNNGYSAYAGSPQGELFVAGYFDKAVIPSTAIIRKWNSVNQNWTPLKGTGADTIGAGATVSSLIFLDNDLLATVNEVAKSKYYIAKWNGSAWKELGTGTAALNANNKIFNLYKDNLGNLYATGDFTNNSGAKYRAMWNTTTQSWSELLPSATNNPFADTCIKIESIEYDKFGTAYAISKCLNANNQQYVAKWNNNSWQELGNLNANADILAITIDTNANVYAAGSFYDPNNFKQYVAKYTIITPVLLSRYNVVLQDNNQVFNQWTTATEINTSHFNIQKSTNAKDYKTIGSIASKGSADYHFSDQLSKTDLLQTKLYYRLEIVDKDGSKTYSETRTLNLKPQTLNGISIYPNPAKDNVTIDVKGAKELVIIDRLGKVVYQSSLNRTSYIVHLKSFTKGLYIIKAIMPNGDIAIDKLLVE